jgi:hypothetical protein
VRTAAAARFWEHCGWTPPGEYDGLPQTGQTLRGVVRTSGLGFFSLMAMIPDVARSVTKLAAAHGADAPRRGKSAHMSVKGVA